jgi:hypothetical protein
MMQHFRETGVSRADLPAFRRMCSVFAASANALGGEDDELPFAHRAANGSS